VAIGRVYVYHETNVFFCTSIVFIRDHLVRSDLCSLKGLADESRSIDVLTSAVPHVWTSTDHRCIVWCRQLVLSTTRALIEIVQEKTSNIQTIMQVHDRLSAIWPSCAFTFHFVCLFVFIVFVAFRDIETTFSSVNRFHTCNQYDDHR
jgi:hypothetical protein